LSEQNKQEAIREEGGGQQAAEETAQAAQETVQSPDTPQEAESQAAAEGEEKASPPEKTEEDKLREQIEVLNDRLLRTAAEYDNFRRRSQREKDEIYPRATVAAVAQFVPVLDNFERALSTPCMDEEFKKGVEMIHQSFQDALKKLGIEEFAEAGDPFNPEMHNAVMHIEDSSLDSSVIVEVFQKGYRLGDRVIRHAMVKVAN